MKSRTAIVCALGLGLALPLPAAAQDAAMSFFVTSTGPGDGANLGGLEGADAHCTRLAEAAGVTGKRWAAYLSASGVNARDRIGTGPWVNAKGVVIAESVEALHGDGNNITKETALNERGEVVRGRGDQPNQHDILTGSVSHARALQGDPSTTTCHNWTSTAAGSAMVGHHDRVGGGNTSWNAAHLSRGCGQRDLEATGGAGLFYCFAVN